MGKNIQIKNLNSDPIVDFISNNYKDIKISQTTIDDNIKIGTIQITNPAIKFPTLDEQNILTDTKYINYAAEAHYESKKEISTVFSGSAPDNIKKATIDCRYNFLINTYEDFILENKIPEINLPDFYQTVIEELISTPLSTFDGVKFFESNLQSFKSTVAKPITIVYNTKVFIPTVTGLRNKMNFNVLLKTYNPFKEQFPAYSQIVFDNAPITSQDKTFTKLFDKYNLYQKVFANFNQYKKQIPLKTNAKDMTILKPDEANGGYNNSLINMHDLEQVLNSNSKISEDFIPNFMELFDKYGITYTDILKGNKNYSEIIGYKISKYDTSGNTPIKEWYLPNFAEEDKTEFIDTQVKYSGRYRYKVSLIVAILTVNYRYLLPDGVKSSNDTNRINFYMERKVYLHEIDSTQYSTFLYDSPPLEPEVEIIPFVGIDDIIKINLNTSIGTKVDKPIFFSDEERQKAAIISIAQDRTDDKLVYNSEEPSDYFEMYRLETPPKNFLDFLNGKKTIIDNNESSAGSINEAISANKKYYYTFRSIDYHGHVSNPTKIFQVELVNNNGMIYPVIKLYEPDDISLKDSSRQFKRYLSVSPSIGNMLVDLAKNNNFSGLQSSADILNSALIGLNNDSIWDKKFKIRVTSLSTGRKMDLNLVFNTNKNKQ